MSEYFTIDDKGDATISDGYNVVQGKYFWEEDENKDIKTLVIPEFVKNIIHSKPWD